MRWPSKVIANARRVITPYPEDNLVIGCKMQNDSNQITDLSGNGNDGALVGPTQAQTLLGPSMLFDGVMNHINFGGPYALTDVTVSVWFKCTDAAAIYFIFNYYVALDEWGVRINAGRIEIRDNIDAAGTSRYLTNITVGNWHHTVAVMDSLENLLYLDGELIGSGENSSDNWASFNGTLYGGSRAGVGFAHNGELAALKLYSTTQNAAWVAAEYAEGAQAMQIKTDWGVEVSVGIEYAVCGVEMLKTDMLINGITEQPVFRYKGGDADGTDIDPWTYGEIMTLQAGAAPSYNQGSPLDFYSPANDSVLFNNGGYYQATNVNFAQVATEDIIFEVVLKTGALAATDMVFATRNVVGYRIYTATGNNIVFRVEDASGGTSVASAALVASTWYHCMFFGDRSGSGQWYVNGVASGGAVSIAPRALTLDSGIQACIGAAATGGSLWDGNLAYMAMWIRDAWLDTHLQVAIAADRYARLIGPYSL